MTIDSKKSLKIDVNPAKDKKPIQEKYNSFKKTKIGKTITFTFSGILLIISYILFIGLTIQYIAFFYDIFKWLYNLVF